MNLKKTKSSKKIVLKITMSMTPRKTTTIYQHNADKTLVGDRTTCLLAWPFVCQDRLGTA